MTLKDHILDLLRSNPSGFSDEGIIDHIIRTLKLPYKSESITRELRRMRGKYICKVKGLYYLIVESENQTTVEDFI